MIGDIDWLRVSNTARYSGGSYAVPTEPVADADTALLYDFNEPPGSTIVHDSSANHWDGQLGASHWSGSTSPSLAVPPVGDINDDGYVDVIDLLIFVDAFGAVLGDANYDARCDFNTDDGVDVVDLLMFVDNFGT
jgi:hypothetical protein